MKGKTIEEALAITNKQVIDMLGGLPPAKIHCSVLAEEAIKSAISDYYKRQGMDDKVVACSGCCHDCHHEH